MRPLAAEQCHARQAQLISLEQLFFNIFRKIELDDNLVDVFLLKDFGLGLKGGCTHISH